MKINRVKLKNFRLFKNLDIKFPNSNFITFIGINGCGKSSILDGIALALIHIVSPLISPRNSYDIPYYFERSDISNGFSSSIIEIEAKGFGGHFQIEIEKGIDKKGFSYKKKPEDILNETKNKLASDVITQLPLLVYYRATNSEKTSSEKVSSSKYDFFYNKILFGYLNSFSTSSPSFKDFEEWFISEENIENEKKIDSKNFGYQNENLKLIRSALEIFLSEMKENKFSNLRGRRQSEGNLHYTDTLFESELIISKSDKEVKINQLSSGEKKILLLVGDIARRLAILNNSIPNSLLGEGIVLIDEIEMHLHPKWQRKIISGLKETFPNIQFIVSTHSPQVLSKMSKEDVIVLKDGDYFHLNSDPKGRDSNGILEEIFEIDKRPEEVDQIIDQLFELIASPNFSEGTAAAKFNKLRKIGSPNDPVLLRIENLIKRKKILNN